MSPQEQHLIDEIRANPNLEEARYIYADWLEDQGDPRAEIVRLQMPLSNTQAVGSYVFQQLKVRFDQLCEDVDPTWLSQMQSIPFVSANAMVTREHQSNRPPTEFMDDNTAASEPGLIQLSPAKLKRLRPDFFGLRAAFSPDAGAYKRYLAEHLMGGDSRAAIVVSIDPLRIAAYTDELDCIAMLGFDTAFVSDYDLKPGSRLLTVNTYGDRHPMSKDLIPGPGDLKNWGVFHPLIADFLTDDYKRLQVRKDSIAEFEWLRTHQLAREYARARPGVARDGRPIYSQDSAI
jgi:uncharacterized protein (TIGR02996 family)